MALKEENNVSFFMISHEMQEVIPCNYSLKSLPQHHKKSRLIKLANRRIYLSLTKTFSIIGSDKEDHYSFETSEEFKLLPKINW